MTVLPEQFKDKIHCHDYVDMMDIIEQKHQVFRFMRIRMCISLIKYTIRNCLYMVDTELRITSIMYTLYHALTNNMALSTRPHAKLLALKHVKNQKNGRT